MTAPALSLGAVRERAERLMKKSRHPEIIHAQWTCAKVLRLVAIAEAARRLVDSQWEHRCSDLVGGCTAVSVSVLEATVAALEGVEP